MTNPIATEQNVREKIEAVIEKTKKLKEMGNRVLVLLNNQSAPSVENTVEQPDFKNLVAKLENRFFGQLTKLYYWNISIRILAPVDGFVPIETFSFAKGYGKITLNKEELFLIE